MQTAETHCSMFLPLYGFIFFCKKEKKKKEIPTYILAFQPLGRAHL